MTKARPKKPAHGGPKLVPVSPAPSPRALPRTIGDLRRLVIAHQRHILLAHVFLLVESGQSLGQALKSLRADVVTFWRHRRSYQTGGFNALVPKTSPGRKPMNPARLARSKPAPRLQLRCDVTVKPPKKGSGRPVAVSFGKVRLARTDRKA